MKWYNLAILGMILVAAADLHAQVKIGDNPQTLDPSSLLELESTNRVLVINRMNTNQMNALAPLQGALVYNTDESCLFYFDGALWQNLCTAEGLSLTDNQDGTITLTDPESTSVTLNTVPVTNVGLTFDGENLVLTDSEGNEVSTPLSFINNSDLTVEPIVNGRPTLVITPNGPAINLEVLEITGNQIADNTINGFSDIQFESIGSDNIAVNAVGSAEIAADAITDQEIDYSQVTLSDFTNDAGYVTAAQLVSQEMGNALTFNNGVFYSDADLRSRITDLELDLVATEGEVSDNAIALLDHVTLDEDLDPQGEIQVLSLENNNLTLSKGGGSVVVDSDPANELITDLRVADNQLIVEEGTFEWAIGLDNLGSDDQTISSLNFDPGTNVVSIAIENGNDRTLDLSDLDQSASTAQNALDILGINDVAIPNLTIQLGQNTTDLNNHINTDGDTDNQNELSDLVLNGNTLTLTNGIIGAVGADLSLYLDNTDEQDLELTGTSLTLTNDATPVDLSSLLDNTDEQDLELTGNTLSLTGDATTVDLSPFLDNTDNQDLELLGTSLTLTNDATPVDLSSLLDNTDEQDLELTGNTLSLTGDATTVDLSPYINSDDQQVQSLTLTGGVLGITLEGDTNGESTVGLVSIDPGNDLTFGSDGALYLDNPDDQTAAEVPINDLGGAYTATNVQLALEQLVVRIDTETSDRIGNLEQIVTDYTGSQPVDGDQDSTNEFQDLVLTGETLTISDGAGSIDFTNYNNVNQLASDVTNTALGGVFTGTNTQLALSELAVKRNIATKAGTTVIVADGDYTLILNPGTTDIQLPDPGLGENNGRILIIKNLSGGAVNTLDPTDTPINFINSLGGTEATLPPGLTWLQSDGANWQQIN